MMRTTMTSLLHDNNISLTGLDDGYYYIGCMDRAYRLIDTYTLERTDHRVYICTTETDSVYALWQPDDIYDTPKSKDFETIRDALNWIERNIK